MASGAGLPSAGGSSGPGHDHQERDNDIKSLIEQRGQVAKESIKDLQLANRASAVEIGGITREQEALKNIAVENAMMASGMGQHLISGSGGSSEGGAQVNAPAGSIKIEPNTSTGASAEIEKNKSIAVQSGTALATSLFSLLWITYIGADAPPEVYAAVAALVPIIGQGVATAINNRKK